MVEHLDEYGEWLHHVAYFAFDGTEAVVEEFETAGMSVLQSGVYGETLYWHFDTDEHFTADRWRRFRPHVEPGDRRNAAAAVRTRPGPRDRRPGLPIDSNRLLSRVSGN